MQQNNLIKKTLTPQQARLKAESYCAYQERAHQEVRDKLYDWGLNHLEVEQLIAELIENNFLNEERFAIAYTLGKFRMKGWGKIKIKNSLKFKKIPENLIKQSLNTIDYEEYTDKLEFLAKNKLKNIKLTNKTIKKHKIYSYLLQKGYENNIIIEIINKIM